MSLEQLHSVKEVAGKLGISEHKVYSLVQDYLKGKPGLRSYRPPGLSRRLIPASAVEEFLSSGAKAASLAEVTELRRRA